MEREQYREIVDTYLRTGSVNRTAELCDTYPIKVRKVLITEGLWHSRKSDAVNALRKRGYSVSEMAEELGMDEKNVQFYLPYANQGEAEGKGESRERVRDFRERGRKTEAGRLFRDEAERSGKALKKEKGSVRKAEGRTEEGEVSLEPNGWAGYLLRFELVQKNYGAEADCESIFTDVSDAEAVRSLMKAQDGIHRDVIVPGWMSLHQLHYVIQEAFGFNNTHLHHFALPGELFAALTGGTAGGWMELCGALWHAPVAEDFSDLYWDDDYRQGKSVKAWVRSKYTGEQKDYAVGETWLDSLRLLEKDREFIQRQMKKDGDSRKVEDLSVEEYGREQEGEINRVLERLKVRDVLDVSPLSVEELPAWRKKLLDSLWSSREDLETIRETRSFRSLEEAMRGLRDLREDRAALDQALWLRKEEVRRELGRNPEAFLEKLNRSIHETERRIGDAMHAFDPETAPVTDTLYYHYDYGDDWLIRVTCREIYRGYDQVWPEERARGEQDVMNPRRQILSANVSVKRLQNRHPDRMADVNCRSQRRESRLENCGWGKNYAEEPVYRDTKGSAAAGEAFRTMLKRAELEEKPVCVVARGIAPVEDVGGPSGLMTFMRAIHGANAEEAASLREWARGQGWKETVPNPERLL